MFTVCMYNYYVWIMLLNCVGTSHCGSLCSQSLCFHIWLELWSGRCAIDMSPPHTHAGTRTHTNTHTKLYFLCHHVGEKRDIALCWQVQRKYTSSFWCSGAVFDMEKSDSHILRCRGFNEQKKTGLKPMRLPGKSLGTSGDLSRLVKDLI